MGRRLFIGLELPEIYKDELAGLSARLSGKAPERLSWTRPKTWHLTLKFLGDTPEEQVRATADAVRSLRVEPFAFRAGTCGAFPNPARPRVLWIGVLTGRESVKALAARVEQSMIGLGFRAWDRPFAPHLTLGRVRGIRGRKRPVEEWSAFMRKVSALDWPEVRLARVVLWQSELTDRGAAHTPLAESVEPA